mmetsp:Transcript_17149/g.49944  ORF Transcript_17149/g.49944 Transcript_17149/m.49944 type:complete len:269 (-) Transcript_17149:423-1229(-)
MGLPELDIRKILVGVEVGVGEAKVGWSAVWVPAEDLEDKHHGNVVFEEPVEHIPLLLVADGNGLGKAPCNLVELDAVLLCDAELAPLPKYGAAVDLARHPHGLAGLGLEDAIEAGLVETRLEVLLEIVRLDLLQADNVRPRVLDLPDQVRTSVAPGEGPEVAVGVGVLRGVDLREDVVRHDPEPVPSATRGVRRGNETPPRWWWRGSKHGFDADRPRTEERRTITADGGALEAKAAPDVLGRRIEHFVRAHLDPRGRVFFNAVVPGPL